MTTSTVSSRNNSNAQDRLGKENSLKVSINLSRCGIIKDKTASLFKKSKISEKQDKNSLRTNSLKLVKFGDSWKLSNNVNKRCSYPLCSTQKNSASPKVSLPRKRKLPDISKKCVSKKLKLREIDIFSIGSNTNLAYRKKLKNHLASNKNDMIENEPDVTNCDNNSKQSTALTLDKQKCLCKDVKVKLENLFSIPQFQNSLLSKHSLKIIKSM